MKVLVVFLSVSAVALCSLEPIGYRPPGSSRYLPPHLQYQQDQHHHYHQHQHQARPSNPSHSPSSQYLTPSLDRLATPNLSSQYLPPRAHQYNQLQHQSQQQQYQQKQGATIPSNNYLPAIDKQRIASPAPPPTDYSPPVSLPSRQQPLNESTTLLNNYLPPSAATAPTPANEYLPVLSRGESAVTASLKNNYLPPLANGQLAPNADYLPPNGLNAISTTAAPRISLLPTSPYKLDGSAFSKPQQQSKFSGSRLDASSLPQHNSYPTSTPSFEHKNLGLSGFDQLADNYLPPIQTARDSYDASQIGYRYSGSVSAAAAAAASAVAASAARVEQATEAAKYDFEYRVSDEFGNDYAHKESRLGNQIQGVYSVLLPDGRKQIVHYEANENGFKPRISYEEVASVLSSKTPAVAVDAAFAGYNKNGNGLDPQGPY